MGKDNIALSREGLDRNSEDSAREVIESALPEPETREEILKLLAESITRAHRIKDASWGITLHSRGVRLNVGPIEVFFLGRKSEEHIFYVVIDEETLSGHDLKELKRAGVRFDGAYASMPASNRAVIPVDRLFEILPLVRDSHLNLVEKAAQTVRTRNPWHESYSPGVVEYLRETLGVGIDDPSYVKTGGEENQDSFVDLFQEFTNSYLFAPKGRDHISHYREQRKEGAQNFESIVAAADRGEDVTERVLVKLLPHRDTAGNRERGTWIHVAQAVNKDIRLWYEGAGRTRAEDWPQIAQAILRFIRRCNEDPEQLSKACAEFSALPYTKGLQMGILTPILNALRPNDFLIINSKSRRVVNHFTGASYSHNLTDYPAINDAGYQLIENFFDEVRPTGINDARDCDLFDMFSHWLVAEKRYFEKGRTRYWKIAPGDNAWQWGECRDGGFIAIGWSELGDISGMSRDEFNARRDELVAVHSDWTKDGVDQVWKFANIREGDRVVANRGTTEVLGIGTVTGPYTFVPGERHGHRLPVTWDDTDPRQVNEPGWRRALIKLDREKFDSILNAPTKGSDTGQRAGRRFTPRTFELLGQLHDNPTREFYLSRKEEINEHVTGPFQELFKMVIPLLPEQVTERMETKQNIFSQILKNDFGQGGANKFYWGAFYPKGGKRTEDAQLFAWINRDRLEFGFYIDDSSREKRARFLRNCEDNRQALENIFRDDLNSKIQVYGNRSDPDNGDSEDDKTGGTWKDWLQRKEWLQKPGSAVRVVVVLSRDEVLKRDFDELAGEIAQTFEQLFPLVLMSTSDAFQLTNGAGHRKAVELNPPYSLTQCANETGFNEETLTRWVKAIERKGQAIFYGPPGTGKTFISERVARHLIGGSDGFTEIVQFHPAYAYEDFILGIRPQSRNGSLEYPLVPGRFLEFCKEAGGRKGRAVLIVDEINRANLARVFGELMYLLEYRTREIPLAGGRIFHIPSNVRIIGTMNTADRSIALVDHALRRRFAFLPLYPNYDVLRHYHSETGFDVEGLVETLTLLNREIGDRHYEVGSSFFMREDLKEQVEDIWRMEIEPYIEEYFFDQPAKVDAFRWDVVGQKILR